MDEKNKVVSIMTPVRKKGSTKKVAPAPAAPAPEPVVEAEPKRGKKKRRTAEQKEELKLTLEEFAGRFAQAATDAQMVALQAYSEWSFSQVSKFHEIDGLKKRAICSTKKDPVKLRAVLVRMRAHLQSLPPSDRVETETDKLDDLLVELRRIE